MFPLAPLTSIFWLVTIAVSVACCSYLIRNVFAKWWDSPVIVAFNKEMVHVGSVPFPSITICPNWSILKEEYNYTDVAIKLSNTKSNMSTTKREEFEDISMICDERFFPFDFSEREGNATVVQNIRKVSYNLFLLRQFWHNNKKKHRDVETVYEDISRAIKCTAKTQYTVVMGDFNAKVGVQECDESRVGPHGFGSRNQRGQMLVDFLEREGLYLMNSVEVNAANTE
ncbi:uncharacterized protein LOC125488975 [Plutella xylostella]|uniref:uncharacterized protein LOC125488975 n=1 Tax=Plutella xylostella TaxID=51655 RepID=UPI002032F564|nr:uncharacterized protein LOC125488975 [Plutella xylostella]